MRAGRQATGRRSGIGVENEARRAWTLAEGRRRSRRGRGDAARGCSRSGSPGLGCEDGMTFLNGSVEQGIQISLRNGTLYRDLPTARLVVSAVNRSTLTRVSSRSEISASVLTSQRREITVVISRLLSPHTLRNRVVQSFSSSISLVSTFDFYQS